MMSSYVYKISGATDELRVGKYMSGIISSEVDNDDISIPHYETMTTIIENEEIIIGDPLSNDFIVALKFINSCNRVPVSNRAIQESHIDDIINEYPKTVGIISAEKVLEEMLGKSTSGILKSDGTIEPQYPDISKEQYQSELLRIQQHQTEHNGQSLWDILNGSVEYIVDRSYIYDSFWYDNEFIVDDVTSSELGRYNFDGISTFRYFQYLPKQEKYVDIVINNMEKIVEFYNDYSNTKPKYLPIVNTLNPKIINSLVRTLCDKCGYDEFQIWNCFVMYLFLDNASEYGRVGLYANSPIKRLEYVGFSCLSGLVEYIPTDIKQKCANAIFKYILNSMIGDERNFFNFVLNYYSFKQDGFSRKFTGAIRKTIVKYCRICALFKCQHKHNLINDHAVTNSGDNEIKFNDDDITFSNGITLTSNVIHLINNCNTNGSNDKKNVDYDWKEDDFKACIYFLKTYNVTNKNCYYLQNSDFLYSSTFSKMISSIGDKKFVVKLMEHACDILDVSEYSHKLSTLPSSYRYNDNINETIDDSMNILTVMSDKLRKLVIKNFNAIEIDSKAKYNESVKAGRIIRMDGNTEPEEDNEFMIYLKARIKEFDITIS